MSRRRGQTETYAVRVEGGWRSGGGDDLTLRIVDPTSRTIVGELAIPASVVLDALRNRIDSSAELASFKWYGAEHYGKTYEHVERILLLDDWSQTALDEAIKYENLFVLRWEARAAGDSTPFRISPETLNGHRRRVRRDDGTIEYAATAWRYVTPEASS